MRLITRDYGSFHCTMFSTWVGLPEGEQHNAIMHTSSSFALLPDGLSYSCCSLIASASAAAPRLHPLQLLLPNFVRFSSPAEVWKVSTQHEHLQSSRF